MEVFKTDKKSFYSDVIFWVYIILVVSFPLYNFHIKTSNPVLRLFKPHGTNSRFNPQPTTEIPPTTISKDLKQFESIEPESNEAIEIRQAFKDLWGIYRKNAFGSDEIRPISGNQVNGRFQGWGATLVDSLSTLWIMNLKAEFYEAVEHLKSVNFAKSNGDVLFFETVIRYLGGLISAYDLSGEKILLEKAKQLGDKLMFAFNTPSGYPSARVNFYSERPDFGTVILAEIGTVQLEFSRLSELTGNETYRNKAYAVFDKLNSLEKNKGLYPVMLDINSGNFASSEITFGALGDSFYEYLLKTYIMDNRTKYLNMFKESMVGLKSLMVEEQDGHLYFGELNYGSLNKRLQHLAFFIPGLLTLANHFTNDTSYLADAVRLADSCYQSYNLSKTGLGPEVVVFSSTGIEVTDSVNQLRPELVESFFYLHKFTGDSKYQKQAYKIFKSFQKYSKSEFGYAQVRDVNNISKGKNDIMESFFFAETFKYMYLSNMPRNYIDLNQWVFNTEAHPLRVKK